MQPKFFLLIHIALLPLYITFAVYFNLIPSSVNLSSLVQLATTNLRAQQAKAITSTALSSNLLPRKITSMTFVPRRTEDRGNADHGWLKTFHTFSFAMYQDDNHTQFGPLRVINEDRVAPRTGFGTHSHREFEIFSYVVAGQLEHKDSMGNTEILTRGTVQLTSAGTGISHSEKTYGSSEAHFLQIWSEPDTPRLKPAYFTREFSDAQKQDNWVPVVAPVGSEGTVAERNAEGPAPVHSALTLYASLISSGRRLDRPLGGKKGYVHVIQTGGYNPGKADGVSVQISSGNGQELVLREGDGAYVFVGDGGGSLGVQNVGDKVAEVLVFDLE